MGYQPDATKDGDEAQDERKNLATVLRCNVALDNGAFKILPMVELLLSHSQDAISAPRDDAIVLLQHLRRREWSLEC